MAQVAEINAVVSDIAAGAQEQATALQEINARDRADEPGDAAERGDGRGIDRGRPLAVEESTKLAELIRQFRVAGADEEATPSGRRKARAPKSAARLPADVGAKPSPAAPTLAAQAGEAAGAPKSSESPVQIRRLPSFHAGAITALGERSDCPREPPGRTRRRNPSLGAAMSLAPSPLRPRRKLRAALLGAVAAVAIGAAVVETGAFAPGFAVADTQQPVGRPGLVRRRRRPGEVLGRLGQGQDRRRRRRGERLRSARMPHFPPGSPFDRFFKQFGMPDDGRRRRPMPRRPHHLTHGAGLRLLHLRRRLHRHQQPRRRSRHRGDGDHRPTARRSTPR